MGNGLFLCVRLSPEGLETKIRFIYASISKIVQMFAFFFAIGAPILLWSVNQIFF